LVAIGPPKTPYGPAKARYQRDAYGGMRPGCQGTARQGMAAVPNPGRMAGLCGRTAAFARAATLFRPDRFVMTAAAPGMPIPVLGP